MRIVHCKKCDKMFPQRDARAVRLCNDCISFDRTREKPASSKNGQVAKTEPPPEPKNPQPKMLHAKTGIIEKPRDH